MSMFRRSIYALPLPDFLDSCFARSVFPLYGSFCSIGLLLRLYTSATGLSFGFGSVESQPNYSVTGTCSLLFPSSPLSAFQPGGLIFQHCISIHFGSFLRRVFLVGIQEWFTIGFSRAELTSWLSSIPSLSLIVKTFRW